MKTFFRPNRAIGTLAMGCLSLWLAGCGSSSSSIREYQVTVTNLSANQPLSPATLVFHTEDIALWQVGAEASLGLEQLAEAGDNAVLAEEAESLNAEVVSGSGVIPPGATMSYEVTLIDRRNDVFSFASMLVNTNDAFAGINSFDLNSLLGQAPVTLDVPVYDSGTELNSESVGTIPGPADGGEGYNSIRDDRVDQVTRHPGVVSSDDGLLSSALNGTHKFDQPVARVTIQRL